MLYVLQSIDPNDNSSRIIGIFDNEPAAEEARYQAELLRSDEDYDAGIFFSLKHFLPNKLYA